MIAAGSGNPSRSSTVGARSESSPSSRNDVPRAGEDQRHGVRRVGRVRAPVGLEHRLGVSVVRRDQADAAYPLGRLDDLAETASTVSTAFTTAGITPVCPTMSAFAKFTTQNR